MAKIKQYILNEVKVIEKECMERGISPIEWIKRNGEEYHRKWENMEMQKVALLKNRRG